MKKFISLLLAAAMLAVPVYGNDGYTQEELVAKAKTVCNIGDYENFDITSHNDENGYTSYYLSWSDDDKGDVSVTIDNNGAICYYNISSVDKTEKSRVYTNDQSKVVADEFLKKALGDNYSDIKFSYCNYLLNNAYEFYYDVYYNGILTDESMCIEVSKYTNSVITYSFPSNYFRAKFKEFKNADAVEEAKSEINKGFSLGYIVDYNWENEESTPKLLYRFDNYAVSAEDFKSVENYGFSVKNMEDSSASEGSSPSRVKLTDEELKNIESHKNTITLDDGVKIVKDTLGIDLPKSKVQTEYSKPYRKNGYSFNIYNADEENPFFVSIDEKGRIVTYYKDYIDDNGSDKSADELKKTAEKYVSAINTSNYELTELKEYDGYYYYNYDFGYGNGDGVSYKCNLKRNGYVSFDEDIYVQLDKKGNLCSITANYENDDIFNEKPDVKINRDEALDIIYKNVDFRPYYNFSTLFNGSYNEYTAEPVFGFEKRFSLSPDNGALLSYDGSEIKESKEYNEYTDLSNQWYAETARNMMYMGYRFEGDEFRGDDVLTFGDLNDFWGTYRYYIDDIEYSEDKIITRYEMAEILMDLMECREYKYNEIYIKPFDDVDFEHTGAVAILKAMGIVGGDSFRGNDNITRAEAVAMLYRYMLSR